MESLPTEILQKILSDLPINDRVRAERVCRRWKEVSIDRVWRDVRVLYIILPLHIDRYHRFRHSSLAKFGRFIMMEGNTVYIGAEEFQIAQRLLSRAGQHVKKLIYCFHVFNHATDPMLSIIAVHCHNIESIQLYDVGYSDLAAFSRLLEVNKEIHSITCIDSPRIIELLPLRNWKSLRIGGNFVEIEHCEEQLIRLIENSPSLEEFYTQGLTPNILAAIKKCEQLKSLGFPRADGIGVSNYISIDRVIDISLLNRLTYLKIDGKKTEYLMRDLLPHCINLKNLGLYYFDDTHSVVPSDIIQIVLALPKLESLELDGHSLTDRILSGLLKFKHLRIESSSYPRPGILNMILNSECLEKLEIPRMEVTTKFFKRLVVFTRNRQQILEIKVSPDIYRKALAICRDSRIHVTEELDFFRNHPTIFLTEHSY